MLLLIMALLAVSGAARPMGSDVGVPARETVSSDGVMQFFRRMYLQQLGAGPSCGTNSSNGGCPRKP
ncbi:hypothetical protein BAE44_0018932 [Dichanthelium oligosanthes]|uniref:Uncharacterized protein n=1 Tax=Dichanthelium oligosanthes TaxID=888268 RepID=A0A1E5V4L7_9POAL|nr:hypothetical protein BAE44_0018932 [Dichanthelium oligosanthes]